MVSAEVRPLVAEVDVARVTAGPLWSCPAGPIEVTAAVMRPREEVAVRVYPPDEFPTRMFPYEGAEVSPVPPYKTPMEVVADTTPLFAWSGPLRVPMVTPPLKVLRPE
jgi:hypothetical protein